MIKLPKHYYLEWRNMKSWYVIYRPTFLYIPIGWKVIGIAYSIAQTLEMIEMHQQFKGEK